MDAVNTELLTKIFESFSMENPKTNEKNPMNIINQETDKVLNHLNHQHNELQQKINYVSETLTSIKELSDHARIQCRPKLSKFIEVDALLHTSEYKLKYTDYSVVSSIKTTTDYCEKSIESMKEEMKILDDHIDRINDQKMLAMNLTGGSRPKEVIQGDNSTVTVYENGLVDIVEVDNEPVVRQDRKAKFKTKEERDLYLKEFYEKQKLQDKNKENVNINV